MVMRVWALLGFVRGLGTKVLQELLHGVLFALVLTHPRRVY